jgi:hypothetical protein
VKSGIFTLVCREGTVGQTYFLGEEIGTQYNNDEMVSGSASWLLALKYFLRGALPTRAREKKQNSH